MLYRCRECGADAASVRLYRELFSWRDSNFSLKRKIFCNIHSKKSVSGGGVRKLIQDPATGRVIPLCDYFNIGCEYYHLLQIWESLPENSQAILNQENKQ